LFSQEDCTAFKESVFFFSGQTTTTSEEQHRKEGDRNNRCRAGSWQQEHSDEKPLRRKKAQTLSLHRLFQAFKLGSSARFYFSRALA
jgi:hypothetical protein